ncbi:hypothetical protein Kpol_543p3 [Vanderwaltozyma polyspora DSM 70294]|uniref:HAD superfamily hydrolase n=1 Tax=Vanderwaltozyma polyspora (strain ATCC 22028 / DSM 70294 / BCRC 21397 / CBS 2163 / NBRC 10782 / NRRL Y-8283 / UCD 57-17) TaxID=436907 RepID=A7THK8_VANPO|nr:uncharacterized protein Kpol_543p3 [Vanderwaltozyma polyspora DSM 70294]EDO18174.1 hypothetical protein Kpol_543p3 [Vanderwaltozyma polyspora DSM 70294]
MFNNFKKFKTIRTLHNTMASKVNIKAVIFDMDGTLCLPQPWMFPAMRKSIGLDDDAVDILTFMDEMKTEEEKIITNERLKLVEKKAMMEMEPQPGLVELLTFLHENDIKMNICTRNLIQPVNHLINNFLPSHLQQEFDFILTRDFRPMKPSPEPLLHIIKRLSLEPHNVIMVGDSYDDMMSGHSAGCTTVLLKNNKNEKLTKEYPHLIDVTISELPDLIRIIS